METYNNFSQLQNHPWAIKMRTFDACAIGCEERRYTTLLDIICNLCLALHYDIWYSIQKKDYYKHVERLKNNTSNNLEDQLKQKKEK